MIALSDCRILAIARYSTFSGLSSKTRVIRMPQLIDCYTIDRVDFKQSFVVPEINAIFSATPAVDPIVKSLSVNAVRYQFKNGKTFFVRAAYDPFDDTLFVVEAH